MKTFFFYKNKIEFFLDYNGFDFYFYFLDPSLEENY